jgi:hypothetical protein
VAPRYVPQPREALAGHRLEHRVIDTHESAPGNVGLLDDALPYFAVRHRREVDHRVRREQIEVRHPFVRGRDHTIDLIGLTS